MIDENLEPDAVENPDEESSLAADAAEAESSEPKVVQPKPKKPAKSKAKSKGKAATEQGKSKGKKGAAAGSGANIASHPRAGVQVRRAKGWGGLCGFGIAAYLSYRAGVPPDKIGIRAIAAGIAGYMIAWACMVTIWRYLLLAELRALAEHRHPRATIANQPTAAPPAPAPPSPTTSE